MANCDAGTKKPAMYNAEINGRKIILLDTPGFDDSGLENLDLLYDIFSVLYSLALGKGRFPIYGVVFLHDISEVRFSGSQRKTLSILRALCGESCMGNVIVGTMRWSPEGSAKFKKEEGREQVYLKEHWGGIYKTKRWKTEHDIQVPTQVVTDLLNIPPVLLLAQEEILNAVGDTTAGRLLVPEARMEMGRLQRELAEQKRRFEEEMEKNNTEAEKLRKELERQGKTPGANVDKDKLEQLQRDLADREKRIKEDKAWMEADAEKQKEGLGQFERFIHKVKTGELSFAEKFGLSIAAPIVLAPAALVAAPVGVIASLVHLAQKFVDE